MPSERSHPVVKVAATAVARFIRGTGAWVHWRMDDVAEWIEDRICAHYGHQWEAVKDEPQDECRVCHRLSFDCFCCDKPAHACGCKWEPETDPEALGNMKHIEINGVAVGHEAKEN